MPAFCDWQSFRTLPILTGMKLIKRSFLPTCLAVALITGLQAADYLVTTQAEFNNLNSINFEPGDRILLQGGQTFSGSLLFTSEDNGSDVSPIEVTSTGTGRATINAGDAVGINAVNTGGFEISELNLIGSGVAEDGSTTSTGAGINFFANSSGNIKYPRVYLDQLTVTGFGNRGIVIGGFNGATGYNDVRITNVVSHGNLRSGIETYGDNNILNALTNVYIADCESYHNVGNASFAARGIVLGSVTGGTVERCLAYDNGQNNTSTGILTYTSANVTIQQNEVHSNKTAGTSGAAGIVLDSRVTGTVIQYNYSHGNDGAGYLLFSDGSPKNSVPINEGNVVRFNISENDGRKSDHDGASGIQVGGRVNAAKIYNNTIFMDGTSTNTSFPAVYVYGATWHDPGNPLLANNLLVTAGNSTLVRFAPFFGGVTTFAGNNYWPSGGSFTIDYDFTIYNTLAAWRTATQQEKVGVVNTGSSVDPQLVNPGNGGTVGDPALLPSLAAYKLQATSPLIDQGLTLSASPFFINVGTRDFHGNTLPQGSGFDVGANEYTVPPIPPKIIAIQYNSATNTVTIDYQSENGVDFGVRRSPDLTGSPATTWTVLPNTGPGDGSVKQYIDNPPPGSSFFYVLGRE